MTKLEQIAQKTVLAKSLNVIKNVQDQVNQTNNTKFDPDGHYTDMSNEYKRAYKLAHQNVSKDEFIEKFIPVANNVVSQAVKGKYNVVALAFVKNGLCFNVLPQ